MQKAAIFIILYRNKSIVFAMVFSLSAIVTPCHAYNQKGPVTYSLGIIVGLIVGLIVGYSIEEIRSYIKRPKITVNNVIIPLSGVTTFYSIAVKNEGETVARNCEGLLTLENIEPIDDIAPVRERTTLSPTSFRPLKDMNLCWARMINGNSYSISIFPKTEQLLDLCKVERAQPPIIYIPSERGWEPLRIALKGNKEYKGELKIVAENITRNLGQHKELILKPKGDNIEIHLRDKQE